METAQGRDDRGGGGDGEHPPNIPPPACIPLDKQPAELKRTLEEMLQNLAACEASAAAAAEASAKADAEARAARDANAKAAAVVAAAEAKARNRPEPAQVKAPLLSPRRRAWRSPRRRPLSPLLFRLCVDLV